MMNIFLLGFGLIGLLSGVGDCQCLESAENEYFIAVRDECNPLTWQEAEDYCSSELNSHLATILNSVWNEYAYEARNLLDNGFNENAWIGLTDQLEEGRFVWTEGHESFNYSNWFNGEPNDYSNNQDCVIMGRRSSRWDDQRCGRRFDTWICNNLQVDTCREGDTIAVWAELGSYTFSQAQYYCESTFANGRLVSIGDSDEQDEAVTARNCLIDTIGMPYERYCWIGLTRENGELEWTDGSDVDYTNFVNNPSNEDCALLLDRNSNEWDYFECDTTFISCLICEDGTSDTNPGTGTGTGPLPTSSPTDPPTDRPTDLPTPRPTRRPTNRPTQNPVNGGTAAPTNTPTGRGTWWSRWWTASR